MALTEAFIDLIKDGENDVIQFILEDGALHNGVIGEDEEFGDVFRSTIFHHAAKHNNVLLVNYLLEKGVRVDSLDTIWNTPLIWATSEGCSLPVERLLAHGADVELKNLWGLNSMYFALNDHTKTSIRIRLLGAMKKKYTTSEALAKRLMTYYACEINEAICSLDARVIEYMIEQGASVRTVHPLRPNTLPALHTAVKLVQVDIVKLLLDFGADPNEAHGNGSSGNPPISYLYSTNCAAAELHGLRHEILKSLLGRRVALTSRGKLYVSRALEVGSPDVIRDILQSPIDFSAKTKDQETLLQCLVTNRNHGVFKVWKEHVDKFDLNAPADKWGLTILDSAVQGGNVEIVEFLLAHGAKADANALHHVYGSYNQVVREEVLDECAIIFLRENVDPQVIFAANRSGDAPVDMAKRRKCFERINSAIAQLAILERRGVPISEVTYSKINSYSPYKKYFEQCRRILQREVAGSVTVFQLLTDNDKKMARYLGNKELLSKLNRLGHKQSARSSYLYYYKVLERRFSNARKYRNSLHKISRLICEISGELLDADNLATEKIIDYLSERDLQNF